MVTQSQDELQKHLAEQIEFIKNSIELYDQGKHTEAKRLAVSVRVLVHDTNSSHSLLGQLNMKDRLFIDTSTQRPRTVITSHTALVGMFIGNNSPGFVPHLDSVPSREVTFDEWWSMPVIIDFKQREISRKRLVLAICNKDGGAHVDPELDEIYADLSRENSLSRFQSSGDGWEAVIGVEHASMRQIAHEILMTLEPSYEVVPPSMSPGIVLGGFELGIEPSSKPHVKVGRNDPCPCGSGLKYKKCCGN